MARIPPPDDVTLLTPELDCRLQQPPARIALITNTIDDDKGGNEWKAANIILIAVIKQSDRERSECRACNGNLCLRECENRASGERDGWSGRTVARIRPPTASSHIIHSLTCTHFN